MTGNGGGGVKVGRSSQQLVLCRNLGPSGDSDGHPTAAGTFALGLGGKWGGLCPVMAHPCVGADVRSDQRTPWEEQVRRKP